MTMSPARFRRGLASPGPEKKESRLVGFRSVLGISPLISKFIIPALFIHGPPHESRASDYYSTWQGIKVATTRADKYSTRASKQYSKVEKGSSNNAVASGQSIGTAQCTVLVGEK